MDHLLSVREIARFLNLNEQTVYRLARKGKIPATKIGRQWRFRLEEIEALLRRGNALKKEGQPS
jgi:excisionase family DNA binding protein